MATTNRQIVQKPDIKIDPEFFVPPDIIDVSKKEGDTSNEGTDETDFGEGEGELEDGVIKRPGLVPPDSAVIVEQIVRVTKGGKYVVDVVFRVPDQDGVTKYNTKVAKA